MADDTEDMELVAKMHMKDDDKKDITGRVVAYIDMARYYVFTSAKENHVSALWKEREKAKNRTNHMHAVLELKAIPTMARFTHASLAMKLSREDGRAACADRAREWQQRHSGRVDIWAVVAALHFGNFWRPNILAALHQFHLICPLVRVNGYMVRAWLI